ncbi:MAG: DUF362 domain-containing protein [Candidatus Zixiibacteriota bacterium]|nr:MAG: DUF362 domain-containing protein [candidate division Zixibacteria bacterium]
MSEDKLKRREFIKLAGKASLLTAVMGTGGYLISKNVYRPSGVIAINIDCDKSVPPDPEYPDLISIKSENYDDAIAAGVGLIGGIGRFVTQGDIVTIKPNIGWDRTPEQGANTNPVLIEAVAKLCFDAGASKVIITDAPCNDFRRTFLRSGIGGLSKKIGVNIIYPEQHRFVNVDLGGEILGKWPVLRPFLETDKLINMPVVKHHNLTRITVGMKNWYGVLGGPRGRLHQQIDTSIADLADFFRPTLIIVDATRVLFRNGPVGGSLSDVETYHTVIAATDQVAADSYSCRFLDLKPDSLIFLKMAESRGLGKIKDYKLIEKI